jgi:acetolactate synthase I/II/III large subunit
MSADALIETTGGMAIVEQLLANGVETVFGLPGAQIYPLFDALQQRGDRIRTYGARHEQACAYMAFGYARSTGRPGIYAVVPGPGVLNTGAALCTALGCNAPVLCLTGQAPSDFIEKGRGHLHELPDQLGVLGRLTKWAARIERIEDVPAIVNEAFERMLSGRPGPVAIEMAWDVMAASAAVSRRPGAAIPAAAPPDAEAIEAAADLLAKARRPMIMTGSGAQDASGAVLALAEALDAPVAAFRGGRGVVAEDHPLGISSYAAFRLWPETDVLLGVGTRLEMPYMRWTGMMSLIDQPSPPPFLIRIDIDPTEMARLKPHVGVVADAQAGAVALFDAIRRRGVKSSGPGGEARARVARAKAEARQAVAVVQPQIAFLDAIREALPRDGLFVGELSQVGFASYFGFPVYGPRTYISEGYQGTLGFGFPTALGVKVAHPDRPVVSVTGDGGFMFAVQELATAAQERIGLITLLFNNRSYGNVLRDQRIGFGNRIIGATLENPDFMTLARAFGIAGRRVDTPEGLKRALVEVLATDAPTLIEITVPQGSESSPWPFIHPKRN